MSTSDGEKRWTEVYPPDFDHGGEPLLGANPAFWVDLLNGRTFLGAECGLDGRVVVMVATVKDGFVEVEGQYVREGEPLDDNLADALKSADVRIPVDRDASRLLGLDVELDQTSIDIDWPAAARRIELDLLSTIQRAAFARALGH